MLQHEIHDTAAGALTERESQLYLAAWKDAAGWLDYAAFEFVADSTTQGYLHHVAQCQREEAERRFARAAGLVPV